MPPSHRPTNKVTPIAHFYSDARIVPDAPGGWSGPYGAGGMSEFLEMVSRMLTPTDFPLGRRRTFLNPIIRPVTGVPPLVPIFTPVTQPPLPASIDRRDLTPDQTIIPVTAARDWFDYWEKKNAGIPVDPPGSTPTLPPQILNPPTLPAPTTPGILETINELIYPRRDTMPLLETIGQVAGDFLKYRYSAPQIQPVSYNGGGYPTMRTADFPSPGIPGADLIPDPGGMFGVCNYDPCKKYVWDPRANCGQGKWVAKSRRRTKRLMSPSQAGDLAKLILITKGHPDIAKVWVASYKH